MRRTPPAALLSLLACASLLPLSGLSAAPAGHRMAASAAPADPVAPIPYRERRLANGLRVLTALDKTTPNATVQVWYGVGAKDDPKGRSGFAHLFEHMMFKATRDMKAEHFDRLTEDVGGENNASTAEDYTDYYELVPGNHLKVLLWAEAERMSSLAVDQANFASERDVVKEELRQRVLAEPYGRFFRLGLPINSYAVHPYKRPGIGSIADLDAATLAEVKAFHDTYYRPSNATLVVVGNFDQAELDHWVDEDFGQIRNPETPLPRVTVKEPLRTAARSVDTYGPTVPLPAVAMTWLAPDAKSPDQAALKVLDALLTTGNSSRLHHDLVYSSQIAQDVFSDPGQSQQAPGLFYVGAILNAGHTPAEGEAAILKELARLRTQPVSAAELARAKNQLLAGELQGRETILGRGVELGESVVLEGDAAYANSDIGAVLRVTSADVMRVVKAYLPDNRRVTVRYRAESERPKGAPAADDQAALDAIGQPLAMGVSAPPAPESLAHTEPAPSAPLAVAPPAMIEQRLPNGLRVIVARTRAAPLVTAELTVPNGAAGDAKAGTSAMLAAVMTEGAGSRSADQIASAVEAAGGSISAMSGYDQSRVVLTVLSKEFAHVLPIMADVVERPTLAGAELERKRTDKLNELQVSMSQPGTLAGMIIPRVVFTGGYGQAAGGTPASVKSLTRQDLQARYTAAYRPEGAVLTITGDIEPEAAFALATRAFGGWAAGGPAAPASALAASPAPSVIVIDLPGSGQAAVVVAAPSIRRADPDYYKVEVANGVLGSGYSSRLNMEVRVKRGLSYGAGSRVGERRYAGVFTASAQTKNESAVEVADLLLGQTRALGAEPIAPSELEPRKAAMIGGFGREIETSAGLANVLTDYAIYGVPLDEIGRFTDKTQAVSAADAQAAAKAMADPARLSLVIVGDAKVFAGALKAKYPNAVVIPASELDLDRSDLGRRH